MPRSFEVLTESPASVERIHAAFGSEEYWTARLAAGAAATTLDSLNVDVDGTVTVRVTQHIGRQLLPGFIAKFVPAEVKLVHFEAWRPDGDRRVSGQISVSASGGLGSGRADSSLAPAGDGAQMRSTVNVEVKIPLVGGRFEKAIGTSLAANIPVLLRFTTDWIAEHG